MSCKTFSILTFILLLSASLTFAQNPKYDNDLDRAMCTLNVFKQVLQTGDEKLIQTGSMQDAYLAMEQAIYHYKQSDDSVVGVEIALGGSFITTAGAYILMRGSKYEAFSANAAKEAFRIFKIMEDSHVQQFFVTALMSMSTNENVQLFSQMLDLKPNAGEESYINFFKKIPATENWAKQFETDLVNARLYQIQKETPGASWNLNFYAQKQAYDRALIAAQKLDNWIGNSGNLKITEESMLKELGETFFTQIKKNQAKAQPLVLESEAWMLKSTKWKYGGRFLEYAGIPIFLLGIILQTTEYVQDAVSNTDVAQMDPVDLRAFLLLHDEDAKYIAQYASEVGCY